MGDQSDVIICRLCSESLFDNNFVSKSTTTTDMLDRLFLDLNCAVTKDLIICTECSIKLKNCFDFKMECSKIDRILSSSVNCYKENIKLELIDVYMEQTKDVILDGNTKDKDVCRFCLKLSQNSCIVDLYETKENIFIVDMLLKHIPEMNLSLTKKLMTCDACLNLLKTMYDINNCLNVDSRINHHYKGQATDDNQIQMNNVKELKPELNNEVSCSDLIEESAGSYALNGIVKTEVKAENLIEEVVNIEESIEVKHEEINIKLESNDCGSSSTNPSTQPLEPSYKCHLCPYKYKQEYRLERHLLRHKHPPEEQKYKCDLCPFWSIIEEVLTQHILIHKKLSEAKMYICELCPFKTKVMVQLHQHMNIHHKKQVYKCKICLYRARDRNSFNKHMATHESPDEQSLYKCNICLYQTKTKTCLKNHMLKHKDPSEVVKYKCDLCPYETIYKAYLHSHKLVHKGPNELHIFKCNFCTYATKRKKDFVGHEFIHQIPFGVTIYKCKLCSYQTNVRSRLGRHSIVHKDYEEIETYACAQCSYRTKRKCDLIRHMPTHKSSSELPMFTCDKCAYKSKFKYKLKRHGKIHEDNGLDSKILS